MTPPSTGWIFFEGSFLSYLDIYPQFKSSILPYHLMVFKVYSEIGIISGSA